MGISEGEAAQVLRDRGFPIPEGPVGRAEVPSGLSVVSLREDEQREALERAFVVGISLARWDDDYAGVSDEAIDLERLAREAEHTEVRLFGEGRRESLAFYARASLVLQDMAQAERDEERRRTIGAALGSFDDALRDAQQAMADAMARVPDDDVLLWGDSEERRLYYFRMGVTNSLRRSGVLDSLGHLYRFQGVDYDVEEAYGLAARECPQLNSAAALGLKRLLAMGPIEVEGLVRGVLPR